MNDIKEKVIVASCLMDENETNQLWELISNNFPNYSWEHLEKIIFHSYDACALYALQVLQAACLDNRKSWEYLSREKTIRDYNQRMFEARESSRQEGEKAGREEGIQALILDNLEEQVTQERILNKLQKHFNLSEKEAKQYYEQYSKLELKT